VSGKPSREVPGKIEKRAEGEGFQEGTGVAWEGVKDHSPKRPCEGLDNIPHPGRGVGG